MMLLHALMVENIQDADDDVNIYSVKLEKHFLLSNYLHIPMM